MTARDDMRYASAAMERLVNELLKNGADRGRLQAKLFGGAQHHVEPAGYRTAQRGIGAGLPAETRAFPANRRALAATRRAGSGSGPRRAAHSNC
jgi:hypothetical protein